MKTSNKISLQFSLFTILIVFLFGITANLIFFKSRYQHSNNMLIMHAQQWQHMQRILGRDRGILVEEFPINSLESKLLAKSRIRRNISKIEERYFMVSKYNKTLIVIDVTEAIESQINLIKIAIYLIFGFAFLSYIFSIALVKNALKNLQHLVKFAKNLNLNQLDKHIEIPWPENDEIKILANTLNQSLQQLHQQAYTLKDFVAHASHELKTPLMAINTELDIGMKTKDLSTLPNIKKYIKNMNKLIQQLLLITQLEANNQFKTEKTNIAHNTQDIIKTLQKQYHHKKLQWTTTIDKNTSIICNPSSREMILQNLIDNAAKYTPKWWKIDININHTMLRIKDTGQGIASKQIEKIRDRFRQEDTSRTDQNSFGLGLYLVKKLVDKHWRNIQVQSETNQWTEFIITFT